MSLGYLQFTAMKSLNLFLMLVVFSACGFVHAAGHEPVSADSAAVALAQGAVVVDVRRGEAYAQGHLMGAVSVPPDVAHRPLPELASLLSRAGVDSSRTVLIVGQAGDANAQALYERLTTVIPGRVLWLVGGVLEWQMTGRPLTRDVQVRSPLPQILTASWVRRAPLEPARMAGSRVRTSALLEQAYVFASP